MSQPYLTFSRVSVDCLLLQKHTDLSHSRLAVKNKQTCNWCRKKHTLPVNRVNPTQTLVKSCSDLFNTHLSTGSSPLTFKSTVRGTWQCMRYLHIHKTNLAASSKSSTAPNVPLAKTAAFRRIGRRKQPSVFDESLHHNNVVSYAVGEEINLRTLRDEILSGDVYSIVDLPRDIEDVLMVTAKYKVNDEAREAFFFRDGGVAFWHMSESERHDLWHLARSFAVNPYDHRLIMEESESLSVLYDSETKLRGDTIHIKTPREGGDFDEESTLHKYTFSNALSQSVSLAMSEASLEKFIQQLEPETQKLRRGMNSALRKKDINMKLGEVFQLRHIINLESGFLDHPDTYWEREELEGLYQQTILYLVIPKRIQVLNERLNYCSEILQLFSSQLNDQHHIRLEWIIIILILIEVIFECIHYAEKYSLAKAEAKQETKD